MKPFARMMAAFAVFCAAAAPAAAPAAPDDDIVWVRIPVQFIAALGDPDARSGAGAERWGLWPVDPGPRGVRLANAAKLAEAGTAPAGWSFDPGAWWLEENGLIMEAPRFPLPPGRYIVTGGRETRAELIVEKPDTDGVSKWRLAGGATLHDVTHLGCRSAVYTPAADGGQCLPANAPRDAFRVTPGAPMPPVPGCAKQDYHVLFIIAVAKPKGSNLIQ
jgi:hypothetical protein